jgi:N-acetyl-1-D-myo-inositol-2-amino-2-deoxy-alpha-D-glucopyranoside deacetylase
MPPKSLLAIFAHPDDESFCAGGALATLAAAGTRVDLLCLTRGEAGSVAPALLKAADVQSVAELRTNELERACELLGVQPPLWLTYQDSGFHRPSASPRRLVDAHRRAVSEQIAGVIATLEPEVLLTFDPHGFYGHPDHIATHHAALQAWFASGHFPQPPERLYYPIPSAAMIERFRNAGFGDLEPQRQALSSTEIAVRLDASPVAQHKRAAILAYISQSGAGSGIDRLLPELRLGTTSSLLTEELYALGATRFDGAAPPLEGF